MKDKNKPAAQQKNQQFDIHPLFFLLQPFCKEVS
jgi:hypothetical protein